jgi:hypothetical protein
VGDAEVAELLAVIYPPGGGPPNTEVEVELELAPGMAIREPFSGITLLPAQVVLAEALARAEEVVSMFERYL